MVKNKSSRIAKLLRHIYIEDLHHELSSHIFRHYSYLWPECASIGLAQWDVNEWEPCSSPSSFFVDAVDEGLVVVVGWSLVTDFRIFSSNQLYPGNSWHILVKVSFCSPNSRNLVTEESISKKENAKVSNWYQLSWKFHVYNNHIRFE